MANIELVLTPASPTGSMVFTLGAPGPQGPPGPPGPPGPQGEPGVVAALAPLDYDALTQTISIDLSAYATQSFVTSQGYITSSALAGYATESWVTSQGYITSTALTPYLTSATAAATYYPLTNPAGYITNSALTPYLTSSNAAIIYRPLTNTTFGNVFISASNLGYIYVNPNLAQFETTQVVLQSKGLLIRDASTNVPVARFEKDLVQIPPEGITFSDNTVQTSAGVDLSVLADYAQLAGASFTGKVNFTSVSGDAGLNVGIGGIATSATTPGDLWIATGGANLNFRDGTGAWKVLASLQNGNVFTAVQTVDVSSTSPALRVTQRGTGNVLLVEDTTTPDTSALVVEASGNVGIGVATGFTATSKVEVVGNIKSTTLSTGAGPVFSVNSTSAHTGGNDTLDLIMTIGGVNYRIGLRPA